MTMDLTKSSDIVKLGSEVYTSIDTDSALDRIPKEVRPDFANHIFTAEFWKRVESTHTPLDLIKERKGSWNRDTKQNVMLEYFGEEYTIQELNRLFPGWWMGKMKSKFYPEIRMVEVKGYMYVEVPTLQGKQTIKRWATGTAVIQYKLDDNGNKTTEASQPDDRFKAARTEWIKLAGKLYGIGLEIYHQRITDDMKSHFEDVVRPLGIYADDYKKIVKTIAKGHGFRNYLRQLPTLDQVKRITVAVNKIPADLQNKDGVNVRQLIMQNFVLNKNDSDSNRIKFEDFIKQIEITAEQYSSSNTN